LAWISAENVPENKRNLLHVQERKQVLGEIESMMLDSKKKQVAIVHFAFWGGDENTGGEKGERKK